MNSFRNTLMVLLLILPLRIAAAPPGYVSPSSTAKASGSNATMGSDTKTLIDVNNLQMFVTNEGGFAEDWSLLLETAKNDGLYYPAGTKNTVVYSAGIWIGGRVNGETRVAVGAYDTPEYFPGPADDNGLALADPPRSKVYKIRKDSSSWYDPQNKTGIKTFGGTPYLTYDSIYHFNDWLEWRDEAWLDGAPLDSNGNPLLLGDQTLWAVFNDGGRHEYHTYGGGTASLGVEMQATFWGYDLPGALGNTIFCKWLIINKSPDIIGSTYVSLWADPDLGGASDDLVGCDTILSLGYCFNATNADNTYGSSPPAVGFDFLQGPLVASPGDTTILNDGSIHPDTAKLGMTSFNKYTNGTDPHLPIEAYGYMKGLNATVPGSPPYINPTTGDTTKYFGSGDPVRGIGWIDSNPADRRFMLSTGPFTMNPGDTQVVVAAIIVGQGRDRLSSISALKFYDILAQYAYDVNFDIPLPPSRPIVTSKAYDENIVLTWTNRSEREYNSSTHQFEGYRVYQGQTIAGPWTQIATYDISNGRGALKDFVLDPNHGDIIYAPMVYGADGGVEYSIEITSDVVNGGGLYNGMDYYFAVTAYSYDFDDADAYTINPMLNDTSFMIPKGMWYLENRVQAITATPMEWLPGTDYDMATVSTLAVYNQTDSSQAPTTDMVATKIIDPDNITGHEYKVTISNLYPDTLGGVEMLPDSLGWEDGAQIKYYKYWEIWDNTTNTKLLSRQWSKSSHEANPVIDGIEFRFNGNHVVDGLGDVKYINTNSANPDPLTAVAFDWTDSSRFLGGAVSYAADLFGSSLPSPKDLTDTILTDFYSTVELRFSTTATQKCYNYLRGANNLIASYWQCDSILNDTCWDSTDVTAQVLADPNYDYDWTISPYGNYEYWGYFDCNFQAWDTINNRQLNVAFVENVSSAQWDSIWNPAGSADREFLIILNSDYSGDNPSDADSFYTTKKISSNAGQIDGMYILWTGIDGVLDDGDMLRFSLAQPADTNDYWLVQTTSPLFGDIQLARSAMDNIKVVPNPYYCGSQYDGDNFDRQVRFMGVPDEFTIRIFNLAGDKIKTLLSNEMDVKTPGNSWAIWNLKTDRGLYVASGIYIWHLTSPKLGSTYGKMAIFPQTETLKSY